MIRIKGQVQFVKDETRSFPVRDKEGNPTAEMKEHRITEVLLIVTLADKSIRPCVCKGFDLPTTYKLPNIGDTWEIPKIRKFDATQESCPTITLC